MTRRVQLAVGILLLWAAGLAVLARRELSAPEGGGPSAAALRVDPGATYYLVQNDGEQVGFSSRTIDTTESEVSVTDYLVGELPDGRGSERATVMIIARLTRELLLTGFDLSLQSGARSVHANGRITGDTSLQLVTRADGGPPDTQHVHLREPVLIPSVVPLSVALQRRPQVGRSVRVAVFDPSVMARRALTVSVMAESLFTVTDSARLDPATRRWVAARTDTVRAWELVTSASDGSFPTWESAWVDDLGRVVEARLPRDLVMRRTAYELAFENWRRASPGARSGAAPAPATPPPNMPPPRTERPDR